MRERLLAWIGSTDLRASRGEEISLGPIAQAALHFKFDEIFLLNNFSPNDATTYQTWLRAKCGIEAHISTVPLTRPTHFGEIYLAANRACEVASPKSSLGDCRLTIHLSPGTPAMQAVWIILAKTKHEARLIESSRDFGVHEVTIPFDISADFLPELQREQDARLAGLAVAGAPVGAEFSKIVHRSGSMSKLLAKAQKIAARDVPVLIEGESGTGKELLARAIHAASSRKSGPFVAVNCGAIPSELVESELFGHVKGAFTGAGIDRTGHFESANGGTLFLDELGELPLSTQVKLLRVLQENEVVPVGTSQPRKMNIRLIAATNRSVALEVEKNAFREDLYYRLAVATLKLPPLRDRGPDIGLLIDTIFKQVASEGFMSADGIRRLSAGARNLLLQHHWPGNIRELVNTLRRAAIWSDGETITVQDMSDAMIKSPRNSETILGRPLLEGFDLGELMASVARHYLERALIQAEGNHTEAARLVGLSSYQTFNNWLTKYSKTGRDEPAV